MHNYIFLNDGAEHAEQFEELSEALDKAFSHLNSGAARPVCINGDVINLDSAQILDAWRKQPEMQMALLAQEHALALQSVQEDYARKLQRLTDTFSRQLRVLEAERTRRIAAYPS